MKLTPLSFVAHSRSSPFTKSIKYQAFAKQLAGTKQSFSAKRTAFFSGAFILAIAISVGTLQPVFAADGAKPGIARSAQDDPLEVPGSFKDLPDARDLVTAKRLPEQIILPAPPGATTNTLLIDTEKGAATSGAAVVEKAAAAPVLSYPEGDLIDFHATAYCLKGRTASGIDTRPGMIAADPRVLPLGTVVHLRAGRYTGTYTVMDTGGLIKGRIVDVFFLTYKEAIEFGRRQVKIKVIGRPSAKARRDGKLVASER